MLGGQRQEPVWPFRVSIGLASIPKKLVAFQGNPSRHCVCCDRLIGGSGAFAVGVGITWGLVPPCSAGAVSCTMPAFSPSLPGCRAQLQWEMALQKGAPSAGKFRFSFPPSL